MPDTGDLPTRHVERLTAQAAVFQAAEKTGLDVDSLVTNMRHDLTVWPRLRDHHGIPADEANVYTLMAAIGCGPVTAAAEEYGGKYTAETTICDVRWNVTVYAATPAVPDVPDAALMAAWRARGDNGCMDCTDRPCAACAAHLRGIAAAVLREGSR